MLLTAILALTLSILLPLAYIRLTRIRLYKNIESKTLPQLLSANRTITIANTNIPPFTDRLAVLQNFLAESTLTSLLSTVHNLQHERGFVPAMRKGGAISFESIIKNVPLLVSLYYDTGFQRQISSIVGTQIYPTPLRDQTSLSLLCYTEEGDHINWHYDYNFYKGRLFTVLLTLLNNGGNINALSHAMLMMKLKGEQTVIPTPANSLVVFESNYLCHRVTQLKEGESRIVISMTYCTNSEASFLQNVTRRFKDTAFYGIRALWA